MDLSRARVVLRERALIDVFDLTLRFVVEHGAVYARSALVVLPPFFVASVLIARVGGWIAAWTVALLVATLAEAPFTVLASRLVFEDDTRVFEAMRQALRATPQLLGLRITTSLACAVGLALFVLPGATVGAVTLFVTEVVLLERATMGTAISRSLRIVGRESGVAIMAMLLLATLRFAAVVVADFGGRAIASALLESRAPEPMWTEGWSYLSLAGFWLFVPYAATARFFTYLDVRTRSEGWDIQTRFLALATRPRAEPHRARSAA